MRQRHRDLPQIWRARRASATVPFDAPVRIDGLGDFVEAPALSADEKLLCFRRKVGTGFRLFAVETPWRGVDGGAGASRQYCVSGNVAVRPSSSTSSAIWQLSRLVGRRGAAVISSIASSSRDGGGRRDAQASST